MTYEALRKVAQPHIRENDCLPSVSFLLLNQLHIPFKNKQQCEQDFGCKMNPLYNTPAFLLIDDDGDKTVYADLNAQYWNFYVFHEIAHYLLGHEDDSPQHEMDANMLACILIAPVENLPTTLKTARDLSCTCSIPIDKAEEYWNVIKPKQPTKRRPLIIAAILLLILLASITITALTSFNISQSRLQENRETNPFSNTSFYMTSSGTHYHIKDCIYIQNKTNIIEISKDDANRLTLSPCKECIK